MYKHCINTTNTVTCRFLGRRIIIKRYLNYHLNELYDTLATLEIVVIYIGWSIRGWFACGFFFVWTSIFILHWTSFFHYCLAKHINIFKYILKYSKPFNDKKPTFYYILQYFFKYLLRLFNILVFVSCKQADISYIQLKNFKNWYHQFNFLYPNKIVRHWPDSRSDNPTRTLLHDTCQVHGLRRYS